MGLMTVRVDHTADQAAIRVQDPIATVDLSAAPDLIVVPAPNPDRIVDRVVDRVVDRSADPSADPTKYVRLMSFHRRKKIKAEDHYYEENARINGYTIKQLLGEGRYGIVYLALDEENNKCVIKQRKLNTMKENKNKWFYEEVILKSLWQSCFPRFIASFKDGAAEGFVMEYMEGEVFEDILYRDRYQFSKEEIHEICSQLLDLVEQLHSCNIVHRDIRLPNVIRRNPQELSLIDFGLARTLDDTSHTKEEDYWYIGDFLIHLYYTTYQKVNSIERPWFKELDLTPEELTLLRRLMGLDETYGSILEIRQQLNRIRNVN